MTKAVTQLLPTKRSDYAHLVGGKINDLLARFLHHRGIKTKDEAENFLFGDTLHDPALIRYMDKVFELVDESIQSDELIAIFGDYDADGVTSTAILYLTLKDIGAKVITRLPDRLGEGYGMSIQAVDELHAKGVKLIITVDNGIKQFVEIEWAKTLGMKVIVLDHHTPDDVVPKADIVIDMYVPGETYPYKHLSGCGLAFKTACHLYDQYGMEGEGMKYLDIAAIGTVSDMVPLTGENRVIVKRGLELMNSDGYSRPGILALYNLYGIQKGSVNEDTIGFLIGPSLNAPGRMLARGAELGLSLLIAKAHEAEELSKEIVAINQYRKEITKQSVLAAQDYIAAEGLADDKVLVLFLPDVPEGVVGLVSGRITEEYHRPSLVFTQGHGVYKASARSTDKFHLYEALTTVSDLLMRWGGHSQAAGMSIEENMDTLLELRRRLNEYADQHIKDEDLVRTYQIELEIKESDITSELMGALDVLSPFGTSNRKPVFLVKDYFTRKKNRQGRWDPYAFMGEDKSHVKLFGADTEAVGFSKAAEFRELGMPRKLDIVATLSVNTFMGRETTQLDILEFYGVEHKAPSNTLLRSQLSDALANIGL
jgi:single-stranded-DNA-specific exonuclease